MVFLLFRPAYLQKARKYKYSPVTRGYEPYIPLGDRIPGYTVTYITVLVVFGLILMTVVAVMVYQITMNRFLIKTNPQEIITKNRRLIASISGAFMSATFIVSLKQFFKRVSDWLTKLENHRTQFDYDNAYIYKNYGFAFINHYAVAFYIAFFKGRFFTDPGDMKAYNEYGGLGSDICETSGCILDLSIQLIVVMVVKATFSNFTQYINPIATGLLKRIIRRVRRPSELPFYQQQFIIPKTRHFFLVDEYIEMIIQYGFVAFFVAAFPLAPFLAFIGSVGELRTDASKLTRNYGRPIPQRVAGLGAWFTIINVVTYLGVITNAIVIAFTSNAVDFQVYRFQRNVQSFLNTTISAYDIAEFQIIKLQRLRVLGHKWCYYPGRRYPPNHPLKYRPTKDFWLILSIRLLVVVVFEHVLILVKGILAYSIPAIPRVVQLQMELDKRRRAPSTFSTAATAR